MSEIRLLSEADVRSMLDIDAMIDALADGFIAISERSIRFFSLRMKDTVQTRIFVKIGVELSTLGIHHDPVIPRIISDLHGISRKDQPNLRQVSTLTLIGRMLPSAMSSKTWMTDSSAGGHDSIRPTGRLRCTAAGRGQRSRSWSTSWRRCSTEKAGNR